MLKVINILLFWLKAVAERVYKSWVPESQVSYTNIQWLREYLLSELVIDMKRKHLNYLISMQSERKQEDFLKGWPCGNTSIIYKSLFNAHTYSLFGNPTCWINSVRFCTLKLFEKRFVTEGFWGICVSEESILLALIINPCVENIERRARGAIRARRVRHEEQYAHEVWDTRLPYRVSLHSHKKAENDAYSEG